MNELFKALENFKPRPVNNNFFVELFENDAPIINKITPIITVNTTIINKFN
jgi:hypothetical protein